MLKMALLGGQIAQISTQRTAECFLRSGNRHRFEVRGEDSLEVCKQ